MGDIFSTKKQSTTNTTENKQNALQGRGQVGVSGTVAGDIFVTTSDPEVIQSALQSVNMATQGSAVAAVSAIEGGVYLGARSMELANASIIGSNAQLTKTFEFLDSFSNRALQTTDEAVAAAQTTALLATPQSPAAYAEITKGQDNKQQIFIAIAVIAAVAILARRNP